LILERHTFTTYNSMQVICTINCTYTTDESDEFAKFVAAGMKEIEKVCLEYSKEVTMKLSSNMGT